ncbi:hypothetical protein [Spirosoma agri]|uniref:Uncharacterized protein n=1 Tax=Spirosoma agri TaxID=1987381 RepID=A0A6M0IJE8_9BACT|nr:hypothetical protein [Spirosoma agri]NEU67952.1 hypothetical protein [Spirosoma agri]
MTPTERLQVAYVRVQHGTTITEVIKTLYGNKRRYREETTDLQRAELSRARKEFLSGIDDAKRNRYPRFFVETTLELRDSVVSYCRSNEIPIARFVNSAIREKLNQAKSKDA